MSSTKVEYDPKLKEAMAEIRALCHKYDIAAAIIVTSESHSEFGLEITPSWSGFSWEVGNDGVKDCVRLRVKQSEVGAEKAHKLVSGSVHLTQHIMDLSAMFFLQAKQLMDNIKNHVEITVDDNAKIVPHKEH